MSIIRMPRSFPLPKVVVCQELRGGGISEGELVASTTMGTLYDLLGALPDDDAEGLRTAFRRAAKATHPDINPDNPDAALRFRQLMRAHNILSDAEQRDLAIGAMEKRLETVAKGFQRTNE